MAYKVNDKIYTDQPMMDEIVYHCKSIFNQIVIKNDVLAANLEYDNSLSLSEAYIYGSEHDNFINFSVFPYNKGLLVIFNNEILAPYGLRYADGVLDTWCNDKNSVPEIQVYDGQEIPVRDLLEQFCNDWFYGRLEEEGTIDFDSYHYDSKFVEKNDYYRNLMGLPPYEDPNLPDMPILKHQYWIYLTNADKGTSYKDFFPAEYTVETPDPDNTPLHLYTQRDITVLQIDNGIERIRELYPGSKFSYVNHMGEKSLDLIEMRRAGKWDILYFPSVEPLVETRFLDLYESNKEIYISRYYEVAQANHSYYYDQNMIIKLLAKVFGDMIVEVPEWYIRRDVLDLRSVEYFLESYGVQFFKQIPLRYQKRIVRNLNKLIKFKSSTRNFEDILDIFELPETMIYKYFLYKKRNIDEDGSYSYSAEADDGILNFGNINRGDTKAKGDWDFGCDQNYPEMSFDSVPIDDGIYDLGNEDLDPTTDPDNQLIIWDPDHPVYIEVPIEGYDLEFVASEIHDSYDEYMRDTIYRTPYDDITYQDKYWDGDLEHDMVRDRIKEQDFTIQGTKYMSIEYQLPANEYFFQIEYFLNLLLSSKLDTDDIKIPVPCIAYGEEFKISDLFVFLSILTDSYYRMDSYDDSTVIKRPAEITPEDFIARFDISDVETDGNYNWKKYKLPEIYTDKKGRIFAFNPNLDKDKLIEFVSRRHTHHVFGRNTASNTYNDEEYVDTYLQDDLDRLGITDFIVPNTSCSTVDELIELYHHDRECYEKFKHEVKNNISNADELKVLEYIYQEMYTAQFDSDMYKLSDGTDAYDMVDILRDRNYVLYNKYKSIAIETNRETRQDIIRQLMNDIIETLQYYLTDEGLEYIFAFTATESFNSRIQYIYLMITFFKSYKVHFIDPYVTYRINDSMMNGDLNGAGAMDEISMLRLDILKRDKQMVRDFVYRNVSYILRDTTYLEEEHAEIVDIYKRFSPDPTDDYDYNGMHPENITQDYKDANGGGANRNAAIPYIMINGGQVRNKVYQLWNLNGSIPSAIDDNDYCDIDGGNPLDFDYHFVSPDWFGKEGFNYIIDGGSPSPNLFISNTMKITLKETGELGADIRLSQLVGNSIQSDPTGIYIIANWADKGDFKLFSENYEAYYRRVSAELEEAMEYIDEVRDISKLERRIEGYVEETLDPIVKVMNIVDHDGEPLISEANQYTDQKAQELYDYFMDNGNVFDWINVLEPDNQ